MKRLQVTFWFVVLSAAFACSSASKQETTSNVAPPTTTEPTATAGACTTDGDCRLFSDYCTACDCRALAKAEADPTCSGPGVRCIADPCMTKTAVCDAGKCTARNKAR